nr:hypothetical protein [Thermoproteota archaeon]
LKIVHEFICVTESKLHGSTFIINFGYFVIPIRYGWKIVYLSNDRIQAYCSIFDHQAKRTVSSM